MLFAALMRNGSHTLILKFFPGTEARAVYIWPHGSAVPIFDVLTFSA